MFKLAEGPATEPVTITEVKEHLTIEMSDDDSLLNNMIATARTHIEGITSRPLITQTWDEYLAKFSDRMELKTELQSVSSILYYDTNGDQQTLATSIYDVFTFPLFGNVSLAYGKAWPSVRNRQDAVIIRFIAGDTSADNVPYPIKQAMLLLVGHMYENREATVGGTAIKEIPISIDRLLGQYLTR